MKFQEFQDSWDPCWLQSQQKKTSYAHIQYKANQKSNTVSFYLQMSQKADEFIYGF